MPSAEPRYDAVVVGSGPNGLAAAITMASAGRSVLVLEGEETVGGGCRTAELTLPGYLHDVCSAIHPLGVSSPLFRSLDLSPYGLEWVQPEVPLAHPLDDGTAVVVERSVDKTCARLGSDGKSYFRLMQPLSRDWLIISSRLLGPVSLSPGMLPLVPFGLKAIQPAVSVARGSFDGEPARALFAGISAHSIMPLEQRGSAAYGLLMCASAHAAGWPLARGGSQHIADALADCLRGLGGEIRTSCPIEHIDELPPHRVALLDVTPRQLLRMAGDRLPAGYRKRLGEYKYGPGVFKVDWALEAPIPWRAAECSRAATVHLGGTLEEIAAAERAVHQGDAPERPMVILSQQTLFDPSRAPDGKHTAWAYCHVPHGSGEDMTARIEAQVERFAPGFGDRILARSIMHPADLEALNPNNVGGDIAAGRMGLRRMLMRNPYVTPLPGVYICSSWMPPGPGVHGMSGYHAAQTALRRR
jgi:phytoene dehydrogenase-like protein